MESQFIQQEKKIIFCQIDLSYKWISSKAIEGKQVNDNLFDFLSYVLIDGFEKEERKKIPLEIHFDQSRNDRLGYYWTILLILGKGKFLTKPSSEEDHI